MTHFEELKQKAHIEFRPAPVRHMKKLGALALPEAVLNFYRNAEPAGTAEIAKIRLRTIEDMVEENRDYVRGAYTQPCAYVRLATTIYGDGFCMDVRRASGTTAPIVLRAHDLEPENEETRREEIAKWTKPIAAGFGEFLQKFVTETLDIELPCPQHDGSSRDSEDMNRP